jgi:hypothetical protein
MNSAVHKLHLQQFARQRAYARRAMDRESQQNSHLDSAKQLRAKLAYVFGLAALPQPQ